MYFRTTTHRRRTSLTRRSLALALAAAALTGTAEAWSIYNFTSHTMRAYVEPGGFDVLIAPGQSESCHWSNTGCNPAGSQCAVLTLWVESTGGSALGFKAGVVLEAGGWANIREDPTNVSDAGNSPGAPSIYVKSYTAPCSSLGSGVLLDEEPAHLPLVDSPVRNVRFAATGDPQFWEALGQFEGRNGTASATMAEVNSSIGDGNSSYRGVLVAGDLTNNNAAEEYDWYTAAMFGFQRFYFDGLGNHDFGGSGGLFFDVEAELEARRRMTIKSTDSNAGAHYSWDWHDVHFVQLNVMPANDVGGSTDQEADPSFALNFLISDLDMRVGNSGRPVVLIHHYGLDPFSRDQGGTCDAGGKQGDGQWFTDAQVLAYWNAIADYNVAAIFSGHYHAGDDSMCRFFPWTRPPGGVGGPPVIPTFDAAALLSGAYLSVTMNGGNQVDVEVWGLGKASPTQRYVVQHDAPILVDWSFVPGTGEAAGGFAGFPYRTLGDALVAANDTATGFMTDPNNVSGPQIPVTLEPIDVVLEGNSSSPSAYAGSYTLDRPLVLNTSGGAVTIGG